MNYDNPLNEDGTKKENKLLGKFKIFYGDDNDYSYVMFGIDKNKEVYKIIGKEVSGYYNPGKGGTRNEIIKLSETEEWKAIKLAKKKYNIKL